MNEIKMTIPKITKQELLEAIAEGVDAAISRSLLNNFNCFYADIYDAISEGAERAIKKNGMNNG